MASGTPNDPTERYGALSAPETGPPALLGAPDAERLAALEVLVQTGRRIGDYRVLGLIGRGGMGLVVLAEQLVPVKRQVALKLMAARRMDARTLGLFEVERQLLARMQHPAIAQIFDAGTTPEGIPYFSMELVEGEPLTRFADQHRLDFRERLALFRKICLGVHHAHSRGIVHRDLKPANILVARIDGQPAPKIIDFGIASLSQRAGDSRVPVAGTAAYMSPEQAERNDLALEPTSDVYSLGVVLFELLTGERPYSDGYGHSTLRTPIMAAQAHGSHGLRQRARALRLDPRRLTSFLKGDVAAVLAKAIAIDPAQRHDSAQALADDLDALLGHRPVSAIRPSWAYRAARFMRRHRLSMTLGGIAGIALLVGLAAILVSWRHSAQARDRAVAEAETSRAVSDFVSERALLDNPALHCDPEARDQLGRRLRQALADIEERYPSQPLVRARIRTLLADALLVANLWEEGIAQQELARREIREATGERSREALQIELAYAGLVLWNERYAEARKLAAEVEAIATRRFGADDPVALEAAILTADVDLNINQLQRGLSTAERVLPLAKALRSTDGGALYQSAAETLANAWRMFGDHEKAARFARVEVGSARRRFGEGSTWWLYALGNQAQIEFDAGRYIEARKLLEEKVVPVYQGYCEDLDLPYGVAQLLGEIDNAEEKYADALPRLEAADRALRELNGEEELMSSAMLWSALGEALIGLGRADEALPRLLAADRIYARDLAEDDPDRQDVFVLLAWAYEALEQPQEQALWQAKVIADADADAAVEGGTEAGDFGPAPRTALETASAPASVNR